MEDSADGWGLFSLVLVANSRRLAASCAEGGNGDAWDPREGCEGRGEGKGKGQDCGRDQRSCGCHRQSVSGDEGEKASGDEGSDKAKRA